MPQLRPLLFASAILLIGTGCSGAKGKAEAAIAAAEQAVTAIGPDGMKVLPLEVGRLTAAITAAKDTAAKGDYAAALSAVAEIPAQAKDLAAGLPAKAAALTAELDTLGFAMTKNIAAVQAKLDEFAMTRRMPKGLDAAKVTGLQETLASATSDWAGAMADIKNGDLASALGKGTVLRVKVSEAMTAVGLSGDEGAWHNLTLPPK